MKEDFCFYGNILCTSALQFHNEISQLIYGRMLECVGSAEIEDS